MHRTPRPRRWPRSTRCAPNWTHRPSRPLRSRWRNWTNLTVGCSSGPPSKKASSAKFKAALDQLTGDSLGGHCRTLSDRSPLSPHWPRKRIAPDYGEEAVVPRPRNPSNALIQMRPEFARETAGCVYADACCRTSSGHGRCRASILCCPTVFIDAKSWASRRPRRMPSGIGLVPLDSWARELMRLRHQVVTQILETPPG